MTLLGRHTFLHSNVKDAWTNTWRSLLFVSIQPYKTGFQSHRRYATLTAVTSLEPNIRGCIQKLVQNLLSFRLISKNLKLKIYKTVILPVVLYGCETWSLTLGRNIDWGFLRTECWGYLDLKGGKTDRGENCIMMTLIALYSLPNIVRVIR
jgi:hypothetical protein